MRFYGNDYRTLVGIIHEVQTNTLRVQFEAETSKEKKIVMIPKNIIRSSINYNNNIEQDFKIPTWFLRKKRIIPLNEF